MSSFYKMDPAAWDFGTADLSLEQEAAYLRIINAIHKHDAGVPDNDRVLAGLFRTSTRKARALIDALIEAGKVVIEDGKIWNDRARSELVQRGFVTISRAESGAKGGRKRADNAAKSLKNNDPPQAIASSRIEENREEYSVATATEGDAVDPAKAVWDAGVKILGESGVSDRQARSFVGKLRKDHPGQDSQILSAIMDCGRAGAVDPIPWITARLRPATQPDLAAIFAKLDAESRQQ